MKVSSDLQRGVTPSLARRAGVAVLFAGLFLFSGCHEADDPQTAANTGASVTFNEHVAPLVLKHCTACHRPGESAPFSFLTYQDVKKRATQILAVTKSGFMPPWLPDAGYAKFKGERRLAPDEIALIQRWVEQGAREGVGEPPSPPAHTRGWKLGKPDLVLTPGLPFTLPAGGKDTFRNFVIPNPLTSPRWVAAVEIRPENAAVVHHAVVQIDRTPSSRQLDEQQAGLGFEGMEMGEAEMPPGHTLVWTPGKVPSLAGKKMAWRLDPRTDFVLQLHLFPSGKPETLRPRLGLYFSDEPPVQFPTSIMLEAAEIDLSPGVKDYQVRDHFVLPVDVEVLRVYPHAHYLGKKMQGFATLPDGSRKWLLRISDWDFNWQDDYEYAQPVFLPRGTTLHMAFTYDNSADNPRNPHHPPRRVLLGDGTEDEMGNLLFQVLPGGREDLNKLDESRWRQKLLRNPLHPVANYNLALMLEAEGRFAEAAACHRKVLAVRPRLHRAHDNLGCVLSKQGEYELAARHFRHALDIRPDYFAAYNNWGRALMNQGLLDEAVAKLQQALKLWPQYADAHVNLGKVRLLQKKPEAALRRFRQAIAADPSYAVAHFNLGTVLLSQAKTEEAIGSFQRAIQLDSHFAEAHNNLGIALYQEGRLQEAKDQFERALKLNPNYVEAKRNLSVVAADLAKKRDEGD